MTFALFPLQATAPFITYPSPKPPKPLISFPSKKSMELTKMAISSIPLTPYYSQSLLYNTPRQYSSHRRHQPLNVRSMAKQSGEREASTNGITEKLAIAGGLISTPVIAWSLYTLKTTGCGLPPGPGGSIGALEGVSYLAVVGIVGWSLYTKSKTGSGLPNGPFGLLGAVEGLSYLSLVAILVVFGLQFYQQGSIPGPVPVPGDQCFG